MTIEIELLPLPEGEASSFGSYEVHTNEAMIEYARANVVHNTALLRAEIKALRAEVEVWKASFDQAASGHATYAERTEQLRTENERLRAENERLQAEVERFRTDGVNAVR